MRRAKPFNYLDRSRPEHPRGQSGRPRVGSQRAQVLSYGQVGIDVRLGPRLKAKGSVSHCVWAPGISARATPRQMTSQVDTRTLKKTPD